MNISQEKIALKVFKRVAINDIGEYSLDDMMLSVLMELDDEKDISTIAQNTNLSIHDTHEAVLRLLELKVVESEDDKQGVLDRNFFDFLTAQLALAIGPIAQFIIEDTIADLGHTVASFPGSQAAELVDLLSREIQRDEKKGHFKKNMIHKISQIG